MLLFGIAQPCGLFNLLITNSKLFFLSTERKTLPELQKFKYPQFQVRAEPSTKRFSRDEREGSSSPS